MPAFDTLKVRAEFLAVRGGTRASVPACLIEARKRRLPASTVSAGAVKAVPHPGPRFGFTVTKKLGNAVTRNRIRRRLKAAIAALAAANAEPGYDYVIVARVAAYDRAYSDILADLTKAFAILHGREGSKSTQRTKFASGKSSP